MADILNFPMLGRLEIVETYAYYDQPVLFSCKNSAGRLYLVVAADENEENETWLFAGMSEERLRLIRSGSIDLHDAFADPEDGFLVRGIVPYNNQTGLQPDFVRPDQVAEDILPIPGERLNLKTDTLPPLTHPEEIAKSGKREILNLTLNFDGVTRTEAPVTSLSNILGKLQEVINTIGMVFYNSNQIDENIKREMGISLLEVGAGSFDIRLGSSENVDLFSDTDFGSAMGNAIQQFLNLLNAGSNQDELKSLLAQLKLRVATSYARYLKSLSESVIDTTFTWVSPNPDRGGTADLSKPQIQGAIGILEQYQTETPSTFSIFGTLIGISLKTKKFEIETSKELYTGGIADEAIEAVSNVTLSQQYTAKIQEIIERSEATDELTKPKYLLLSLSE